MQLKGLTVSIFCELTLVLIVFLGQLVKCLQVKHKGPWPVKSYPNPWDRPMECRSLLPSSICDPDGLFSLEKLRKIRGILWDYGRQAPCLCDSCLLDKNGITIVIALMEEADVNRNKQFHRNRMYKPTFQQFADSLREQWDRGSCENDLLLLITSTGGAISYGNLAKKVLERSTLSKLKESDFPTTPEEQSTFINSIIQEVHSYDILANSIMPTIYSWTTTTSWPVSIADAEFESTTAEDDDAVESEIVKKDSKPQLTELITASGSKPWSATSYIAAQEDDEFKAPEDKKVSSSLAFVVIGSFTILLVSLIALFLIIWYYRTRTGTIQPNSMVSKPQTEEKVSSDIKSVKYEPCKTDEPGLPV